MPLEDLTGNKTIDALNPNWPLGTDLPDAGDDHIRGHKNVTLNTWPNITGPVTLTQDQINRGSIPVGSRALFYQAAAPDGWTRVAGLTETQMLRVVASANAGGTSGGADDPVLNSKVASHVHPVPAIESQNDNVGHTHSGTTASAGAHSHDPGGGGNFIKSTGGIGSIPGGGAIGQAASTTSAGAHTHSFTTGNISQSHTHIIPTQDTSANTGAGNWVPRYLDVILCERAAL